MNGVALALTAFVAVQGARANASLEKCRSLEREFDYKGMLTECGVAAAEPHTTKDERVEIYRLLGIAHATLGEAEKARVWFLKLLTLQPDFKLPQDASPKFRESFADAVATFSKEGAVSVVHTPPTLDEAGRPGPVVFEVVDRLGRVGQGKVRVQAVVEGKTYAPVEAALLRQDSGAATARFTGELPDPVLADPKNAPAAYQLVYELVLETPGGDLVQPATPLPPVPLDVRGPETAAGADVPWLWIGAGTGAALVVAGAATGIGLGYCFTLGPCREEPLRIAFVRVSVSEGP
jgi:hypothetical protein